MIMLNKKFSLSFHCHCHLQSDSSTFTENVRYLMYKYEIPIFVWE